MQPPPVTTKKACNPEGCRLPALALPAVEHRFFIRQGMGHVTLLPFHG